MAKSALALDLTVSPTLSTHIGAIIARVKQLFDLSAAPDTVSAHLGQDALLEPTVKRLPGLRVAGAFDGFELAVRTIVGQQVSVKGASTIAGRWAAAFGKPIATPYAELNRVSPAAESLSQCHEDQIAALGMVGARARCLIALAQAVAERRVLLSLATNVDEQIDNLLALPGIGHWTANYIAMRALHWPDAFPTGDLMLMRAAGLKQKQLQARAEAWRPWRAYSAQYLWQSLGAVL
jgi:AraC family transcriptional regulator of adaptative response / DNA-3-methyladenine glycosylase II